MIRLECPVCKKDSYTASVESFRPCPYCGILFSGISCLDKRKESRTTKNIPFVFSHMGLDLTATIANFSKQGLSLRISGKPALSIGDIVDLNIRSFHGKARVMWVNPLSDMSMAGFRILEQTTNSFF
ncbi:MAG: PilZ domain-containing protein [Thermodesulfovibrionales bacterium]|nr:PilZ domain-containing protein [Thermodesulfovibrionales bacterium]